MFHFGCIVKHDGSYTTFSARCAIVKHIVPCGADTSLLGYLCFLYSTNKIYGTAYHTWLPPRVRQAVPSHHTVTA
jgi:hypothetical protein